MRLPYFTVYAPTTQVNPLSQQNMYITQYGAHDLNWHSAKIVHSLFCYISTGKRVYFLINDLCHCLLIQNSVQLFGFVNLNKLTTLYTTHITLQSNQRSATHIPPAIYCPSTGSCYPTTVLWVSQSESDILIIHNVFARWDIINPRRMRQRGNLQYLVWVCVSMYVSTLLSPSSIS